MKNNRKYISIFLLLCLASPLNVIAIDLQELYRTDYKGFWDAWTSSKEKATKCNNFNDTAHFLSNSLVMLGNAEVTEANSEIIETLVTSKAKCFLEAVLLLPPTDQRMIYRAFIKAPLFKEEAEINASLEEYLENEKYKKQKSYYKSK